VCHREQGTPLPSPPHVVLEMESYLTGAKENPRLEAQVAEERLQ
jgi:hypothetical protein